MNKRFAMLTLCAACLGMPVAVWAADIQIVNLDSPGEGLNDSTARTPVGGNSGTTLGEQRLRALEFVADLLGQRLGSSQIIRVAANFDPLNCEQDNADLGAAAPTILVSDFPGAQRSAVFYPIALANALANRDLDDGMDISASFNSTLDDNAPNSRLCLGGADWYYGLDDAPPAGQVSFISTATHELIHGLGFVTFTQLVDDPNTPQNDAGAFITDEDGASFPDIYAVFILDLTQSRTWPQLSPAQRATSARNDGNVVWNGPVTSSQGAPTLTVGTNGGSRVQLYAPPTVLAGSSISHWDTRLVPNALMEPFDTGDSAVVPGIGLASCLLEDIGWQLINNTRCPDMGGVDLGNGSGGNGTGSTGGGSGGGCSDGSDGSKNNVVGAGFDPTFLVLMLLAQCGVWFRGRQKRS